MLRALACLALLACGSNDPAPTSPGSPAATASSASSASAASAESTEPLPPVTAIGDRCRVSKDCSPLGSHHKCMRTSTGSFCHESPMRSCEAAQCSCFNNDPCVANDLGTCSAYEDGVIVCAN